MKLFYWLLLAILCTIHLQSLPLGTPIYLSGMIAIGVSLYFFKKIDVQLGALGVKWNALLFGVQVLLLSNYIPFEPQWIHLSPLAAFVAIEIIRQAGARKLSGLKKEIAQFTEQTAHFNETFRVVRSERHDFLKHISALHFMLENGKNEDAAAYLDGLVDGYEETNLSIKGERGSVAGILHEMYRRAKAAGIEVVYDFDLPLSTLPLSDQHLVGLLGNLLDNSIDACEEWQKGHGKTGLITLQFYKRSGLYLLSCKNSSLPIPTDVLDHLFKVFGRSTKAGAEHEGLGTKIIHDVVAQYNGFLDFVHKDEEFTVKIKFPAIH